MKRHKDLYSQIYDFNNLYTSYLNARKGKRYRNEVLAFSSNLEENLIQIQNELIWEAYQVSPYRQFFVYEPKKRLIMALPFKDRIVQWGIYLVVNPLLDRRYIEDSYACRIGYGAHKSVAKLQKWLRELQRFNLYVLRLDVAKYFYRIDHDVLMNILSRIIKDSKTLNLLDVIVRCDHESFGLNLDDTDFSQGLIPGVGMPIGNLSSQMFANLYLNELDQYIKHELKVKYYMRYMDDSLMLHWDKKVLWEIKNCAESFLEDRLKLRLNEKTCIRAASQGIDWVGFRVWPTHIRLRKSSAKRMKRRLKHLQQLYGAGEIDLDPINASIQSYLGILGHCNSYNLRNKVFSDLVFTKQKGHC